MFVTNWISTTKIQKISEITNFFRHYFYPELRYDIVFNVDEAVAIIEKMLMEKTKHGTKIKLHGGEPFLVFPKIKQLCETLWSKQFPEYYHFSVTTNGTLIHGEIKEWLYNNRDKITLKLSLDGNRKSHNINRSNSFDRIDLKFFVRTWPKVRLNMVITPATLLDVCENIKFLHSQGFTQIISRFSLMTDWKQCNLQKEFYYQMLNLAEFYLDNPTIEPCEFFSYDISWVLADESFTALCNIGNCRAFDFQTRKYYPCHMCFPSVCGEKKSRELEHIEMSECNDEKEECCVRCPFINICKTCYAENYIMRGSVSRRDTSLCAYQKIVFVVLFKYEYARILKMESPTAHDVQKMMAIQKMYPVIQRMEEQLENG